MSSTLRFIELFVLGTWIGSIIFLSFVVAPGAFGVLSNRDQAGLMVGHSLARLHWLGIVAGVIFLAATALEWANLSRGPSLTAALVLLMMLLTYSSQRLVSRPMAALRQDMGSVDKTPPDDPRRQEFDKLHRLSVRIEGAVLLLGVLGFFITVQRISARPQ
jgi:uncharacterized membrane protein